MSVFHVLRHTIFQIILVINAQTIAKYVPINLFVFNAIKDFTQTQHHHIPASNAVQTA